MHDALLFVMEKPNSENYKNNVLYKGPVFWNARTTAERNFQSYDFLKNYIKDEIVRLTLPGL